MPSLGDLLVRIGADISGFETSMGTVNQQLTAAVKEWDKAGAGFEKFGSTLTDVGTRLTVGLTVPIAAIGTAAIAAAMQYDDAVDTIRAGTGAVGTELASLSASFKTVFTSVPASASEVATAIADLNTRLGLSGPQLEALSTQMLNLARITGEDVGTVIQSTTRLFGDWSISTDKQSSTLDYLYKVSQSTGIGINDLSTTVVEFGAPLRALGFDLEDAAAMMGKWEREGVNTETVLAGLKMALKTLAAAGKEPAAALEETINAIKNAKTESESTSIAMETFGKRAGVDMARAILEGRLEIDDLVTSIKGSKDTINTAAADTLSFSEKWVLVKNKVASAIEPLGTPLLSALESLMSTLEPVIASLGTMCQWFSELPAPVQATALAIGAAVAATGPLLVVIGQLSTSIGQIIPLLGAGGLAGALTKVSMAAGVGAAAFAGWKLGEWLQSFTTEYKAAEEKLNQLNTYLQSQGVIVERGNKSLKEWAQALFAAQDQLEASKKATASASQATEEMNKQVAKQQKELKDTAAIEKYNKAIDDINKANKEAATRHAAARTELVKLHLKTVEAREAFDDFRKGLIKVNGSVVDFVDEANEMSDEIADIQRQTTKLSDIAVPVFLNDLPDALKGAISKMEALDDAYKSLGVTSASESAKIIDKANAARDAILGDENASEFAKKTAIYQALKIQIEQAELMGQKVPAETRAAMEKLGAEVSTGLKEKVESPWTNTMTSVSTAITNCAQDLVDGLWEANSVLEKIGQTALTSFAEPIVKAFTEFGVNAVKAFIGALVGDGGLSEAFKNITSLAKDLYSTLKSVFGVASSAGSTASTVAGAAGSGSSGVASAAGSVASAASGTVGIVSDVIGAIYSIRQEGTLNAIEKNTRYCDIGITQAGGLIEICWGLQDILWVIHNTLWVEMHTRLEEIRDAVTALNQIFTGEQSAAAETTVTVSSSDVQPLADVIVSCSDQIVVEIKDGTNRLLDVVSGVASILDGLEGNVSTTAATVNVSGDVTGLGESITKWGGLIWNAIREAAYLETQLLNAVRVYLVSALDTLQGSGRTEADNSETLEAAARLERVINNGWDRLASMSDMALSYLDRVIVSVENLSTKVELSSAALSAAVLSIRNDLIEYASAVIQDTGRMLYDVLANGIRTRLEEIRDTISIEARGLMSELKNSTSRGGGTTTINLVCDGKILASAMVNYLELAGQSV